MAATAQSIHPATAGTRFIAEVSSNHHQSLARCKAFIQSAAHIGCDAVKFQLFRIDELFAPEVLARSNEHRRRAAWELPLEFIPELRSYCDSHSIEFSCTPFYLQAVEALVPHVHFLKIASYELVWTDLLIACARSGLPVVLSTGMATLEEIDEAMSTLHKYDARDITLLHCVSAYPTPPQECNLAVIESLRRRYGVKVGWSDHSVSRAVVDRAIHRWQADALEFHLDLDRRGAEYATGHCWLPKQMEPVIQSARQAATIDGVGVKQLTASERADRAWRADPDDGLRPLRATRGAWQ